MRRNEPLLRKLRGDSTSWVSVQAATQSHLPETLDYRLNRTYQLTPEVLTTIFATSPSTKGWKTFKQDGRPTSAQRAAGSTPKH